MDESLDFTPGRTEDLPRILEINRQAHRRMRQAGSRQWQHGDPSARDITADLAAGRGRTLRLRERVIAYAAVGFDGEPAYLHIDGQWLTPGPYAVVHRLAVADEMKHRGVARTFMLHIEALARSRAVMSVRADTSFDNLFMLRLLDRLGYRFCGEIRYPSGLRRAFEKPL